MQNNAPIFQQLDARPRRLLRRHDFVHCARMNGLGWDEVMTLDALEALGLEPLVGGEFVGIIRRNDNPLLSVGDAKRLDELEQS